MAAIRRGLSQRAVARQWNVTVRTVQKWLTRAGRQRLDRVDWRDRREQGHAAPNRTPAAVEAQVLALRLELQQRSVLGEYGARAIQHALQVRGAPAPALRTIGRILRRRGALDGRQRARRPPPPPGWHLPGVATGRQELDCFDFIEDLKLAGGPLLAVFTAVSLHGGLPGAWPLVPASTTATLGCLATHWRTHGRPSFAQFDNDTRFQGPHQHRDVIGRVSRCCLQLDITPVFVPPREFGLQNAVEQFNGLFLAKVWRRWRFPTLAALASHTWDYVAALTARRAARLAEAPARAAWPGGWEFDEQMVPAAGTLIYIRRTSERGEVGLLGRRWRIDPHWLHRLVRVELDLRRGEWRAYALRRSAPTAQPLLMQGSFEPRRR